jgi:uncharacterized protein YjbJ (UPF0337 family)
LEVGKQSPPLGSGRNAAGRFKEGVGRVLGDNDLADEGLADQFVGTVKSEAGALAQAVGETIQDLNR